MRLKIGEFARLGQVSVQALRYYDTLGLLKPAEVDLFSSYRYYTLEQLPELMRILAFKDLGFSLEQITQLLKEKPDVAALRGMLLLKQQELRTQLQEQLDQLDRVDARLRWMEQERAAPPCEVILKRTDPVRVVSVRGLIPTFWEVNPLWMELQKFLEQGGLAAQPPYFTLCHAVEPEIDVEVCAPVPFDRPVGEGIPVRVLPAVETMACTVHHGPFTGLAAAFTRLMQWIDANGFSIAGPDREIYLRLPEKDQHGSDPHAITELQVPVVRQPGDGRTGAARPAE